MGKRAGRWYTTRTNGRNYVLHVKAGDKTLCGRVAADVNCAASEEPREALCRVCAARKDVAALASAVAFVNTHHPLPRCGHGNALRDHGGEPLFPRCGCCL